MQNKEHLSINSVIIPMPKPMYKFSLRQRYIATEITIENQSGDMIEFEKVK
jgi:hypothetical protein